MEFNDTTDKLGMIQDAEFWVFGGAYGTISGDATLLDEFTRLFNLALDRIVSKILNSDTRWQWDDTNNTNHPIGTMLLVDGQQDYELDTTHLKILGVEVMDSSGNYQKVNPIDYRDIRNTGTSQTEFMETDGMPAYYDLLGESIFLYPAPAVANVTLASGLKVFFQRGANQFASSDTTKEPGFASIYHRLVPLYASYDYAVAKQMNSKANGIFGEITKMDNEHKEYLNKRGKDEKPIIRMRYKSPR